MTLLSRLDRSNRVWFVISGVMVIVIAALVIALLAISRANDARRYSQAVCPLIHTLSQAPLPDNPQAYSLTTLAGLRATYEKANCAEVTGHLDAPDSRLLPYIAKFH